MPSHIVRFATAPESCDIGGTASRKVARASDGTYWSVYRLWNGITWHIYCAYSNDGGLTWNEEQVSVLAVSFNIEPSIAIDSNDNIHIVWVAWTPANAFHNVHYRERTAIGVWNAVELVTDVANNQNFPAIAVDSNDTIHVTWSGRGWGMVPLSDNIQYCQKLAGVWQAVEQVTDIGGVDYYPTIAIDIGNDVHVVWSRNQDIGYCLRTAGVWGAIEMVTATGGFPLTQYYPVIAIGLDSVVHVAWLGLGWGANPGNENIQYRQRLVGIWQAQEAVTDNPDNMEWPSISLDTAGIVYVVWNDTPGGPTFDNIYQRNRVAGIWGVPQLIVQTGDVDSWCQILWAMWPLVGGRRTNIPISGIVAEYYIQGLMGVNHWIMLWLTPPVWSVKPVVTTDPATEVVQDSAITNGTLDDDGGEACDCGFEWGLTPAYGNTTPTQSRTTGQSFERDINGLISNTEYHFRAFATNAAGTGYGSDRSFTTKPKPSINKAHALSREEL